MEIIYKKVNNLIPYINNSRTHSEEQVNQIVASINEFGFTNPLLIDEKDNIIAGHGRLLASKKLKMEEVPCIVLTGLTEAQKKAYIIADNKMALNAGWNEELLKLELENLKELDFDLKLTGFDIDELDDIFQVEEEQEVIEDDFDIEPPEEPKAKLGDIYQLGNHRLMCGDSTSEEDVALLMNGVKADMVFTDPPYGMKKENAGVANDNLNYDDLLEFNKKWIPITFNNLKDNGSWYCWGTDEPLMDIYSNILKPMARENKVTFRNLITWDKGNGQGQLSSEFKMYPIADEKCLFVQVGIQCLTLNADQYWEEYEPIRKYLYNERIKCSWDIPTMKTIAGHSNKSRDHWTSKSQWNLPTEDVYIKFQTWAKEHNIKAFTKPYEELRKQYEELRKQYEELRAYFDNTHDNMNDVWHFSKTSGEERESTGGHATPKPIALCTRAIKSSSRENEIVLDVFGGSGSTLIACEQNNRSAYLMELEPQWVDVIIKRWEEFTGKKAIKLN
jgi:DNA modification methylase